jgi:hypothetical protein
MGGLNGLTRTQAEELLQQLKNSQALAHILEDQILADGIELHPATVRRLEQARIMERALLQLLATRAPRPAAAHGATGRPLGSAPC